MKKIPIGHSDFKNLRQNPDLLYIDKTALIEEFLEDQSMVLLITRPRRFGKTLNLSTLRYFFDLENAEKNRKLFEGLKISENAKAMAEQGTRPVVYLTFKDCKALNWADMQSMIQEILGSLAETHLNNLPREKTLAMDAIEAVSQARASYGQIVNLPLNLCSAYAASGSTPPLILIDEYDVPLQTAWLYGYYEKAISFFRNFFSAAFKDNPYLWRGVMTGCLRVSKESIFTGLNNLKVTGVSSEDFSTHFGLTEKEVKSLLLEYGYEDKTQAVERWYNGYIFGKTVIYNPWSILSFLDQKGLLKAHWVNTSSNDMVHSLLRTSSIECKKMLEDLIAQKTIEIPLLEHSVFDLIASDTNNLWNFLYFTGYLKAESIVYPEDGKPKARFKIPNREVLTIFKDSITYWFQESQGYETLKNLHTALKNGDGEEFSDLFEKLVSNSLSYFDVGGEEPEQFYHAFTLGLIVNLSDAWHIRSNREAGTGRCDILMIPKNSDHFGVVMELKTHKPQREKDLSDTAQKAMDQIEKKGYVKELLHQGCQKVMKIGIGFLGKRLEILSSTVS
ncbi:MAG: AAA family ATPase [Candidatus Cloacimonetes bacterium]|nr:AAA family ATPase [Candidatus Cloacimonadota bacterium]